jgi:transcriptional regulator with XRE-family HTH domain
LLQYRFSGARLRAAREAAGLTREEVAVRIHRSLTVVQFAETDKHQVGIEKAAALAAAVGVRVDDLLEPVDDEQGVPAA